MADHQHPKVLEPFGPLSQSIVWSLVADVYKGRGLDIWETVPASVTGNPVVGDLFAGAVEAWLLDRGDAVDAAEPLYVLELGAGTGLFSHYFLTSIARRRARGGFPHPRVVLVMCDQADLRLDAWAEANALAPHLRAGTLDFASFTVDERGDAGTIVLQRSGTRLSSSRNPLVVVANYFFDSIPCDAFRVREGRLYEAQTRFVRTSEEPGFEGLKNEEKIVEIDSRYYGEAALDRTLASYALDAAEASLLMPVAGIRCLQALMRICDGRLLLLSLDKGITRPGRLEGWGVQPFVAHGGVFSYMVNFDAFRRYFESSGGSALSSSSDERSLVCFVGTLPGLAPSGSHLRRFFDDQIDFVDAVNAFVSFSQGIHALPVLTEPADVAPLFDLVARLHGDADAFAAIMYRSVDVLAKADDGVRDLARRMAALAKQNFFSPRVHNDAFYWSGRLHFAFGEMDVAERDFLVSVASFAGNSYAHLYLGTIAEGRGDIDSALLEYEQHRLVEPECPTTRSAILRVHAKLAERSESAPVQTQNE